MKKLALLLVVTSFFFSQAYAKPPMEMPPKRMHQKGKPSHYDKLFNIMKKLNLTENQKTRLRRIKNNRPKRGMNEDKGALILGALTTEGFNKKAYIQAKRKIVMPRVRKQAQLLNRMFSVLTKEQRANFIAICKAKRAKKAKMKKVASFVNTLTPQEKREMMRLLRK